MKICKKLPYTAITILFFCFVSGTAFANMPEGNGTTTKPMSTSQVKKEIKKKHKGKIISIERKATRSHPNCHIVKMVTKAGEFKYIRYSCGR